MIIYIFFFIISLILYLISPDFYSYEYCLLTFIIFTVSSLLLSRRIVIKGNYLNFHILFLISFLFVNFVYPVFIYPVNPYYFSVFKRTFDHSIITKATTLALLGICSYQLGAVIGFSKKNIPPLETNSNYDTLHQFSIVLLCCSSALIFYFGGSDLLRGYYGSTLDIPTGILELFQVSIGVTLILSFYKKGFQSFAEIVLKFNVPVLIILIVFLIVFVATGDRGPVIKVVLLLIGAFTFFIKPLRLKSFIVVIVAGMIILTFISYARHPDVARGNKKAVTLSKGFDNFKMNSFYDVGMDLIVCNRNLYAGYEYVENNGISYGKNMFSYIFAPIPMLPKTLTKLFFNTTPEDLSTANIITKNAKSTYGLGTNLIIDLYMAFGTIGVIVCMYLLGYFVSIFLNRSSNENNLYSIVIYLFLLSFSIYLPRTSILEPFRSIIWAVLLLKFLMSLRLSLIKLSKSN